MMLASVWLMHVGLLIVMAKQFLELGTYGKLAWLSLTANMLIETDNASTASHNPMQIMGYH